MPSVQRYFFQMFFRNDPRFEPSMVGSVFCCPIEIVPLKRGQSLVGFQRCRNMFCVHKNKYLSHAFVFPQTFPKLIVQSMYCGFAFSYSDRLFDQKNVFAKRSKPEPSIPDRHPHFSWSDFLMIPKYDNHLLLRKFIALNVPGLVLVSITVPC